MSERLATVDQRGNSLFVTFSSRTADGFWVVKGNPARLDVGLAAEELGHVVRAFLNSSREGAPKPGRDTPPSARLLALAGASSYRDYARGTTSVEVFGEDTPQGEVIELTPMRNVGGRGGFEPVTGAERTMTYESPEQLGAAVLDALTYGRQR